MEPQKTRQPFVGSEAELIQLVVDTYHGRTQEDVRRSELIIIGNLYVPGFMERLSHLLLAPSPTEGFIGLNQQNFRRAIANLIKKFSYDWAQKKGEKQMLVRSLFELIMNQTLSMKVKQLIGIALEHQLNADEGGSVRQSINNRVIELISGQQALNLFGSLLVVETAYLNSLVEVEDQILALEKIIPFLGEAGLQLHRFIVSMPMEEWLLKDKLIMPQITKLFQLLETQVERMMDEREYFKQEIRRIRESPYLQGLLQQYLLLFHCNHSVVSQIYPHINPLKNIMLSIICQLFEENMCSQRVFHIIFLTFLAEAKTIINDVQVQHILVSCLTIMEGHMHKKFYLNIFTQHTMETIFSLFMYSASNQEECDAMIEEPEKFMQIAEQYTEADTQCSFLKIKAANLLRVFASTIDGAPRRILEMLMVILNGSLQVGENESALLQQIKNEFSKFNFFGLDEVQKIQTSLMILATLSSIFSKRPDMNKVIIAFFLTQYQQLGLIENQIISLRIMRVISYYPCALYFLYIQQQMCRGPVFVLEGIKALERILRTNRFNELFQFIGNIIGKLMNVLKVTDPIMELIIINNFDKMLINSNYLYRLVRNKLKQEFFVNYQINQHACIVCFNLFYVLIKKEERYEILVELENEFEQISTFLQIPDNLEYYNRFEEKLVEIYMIIMNKHASLPKNVENFAEKSLTQLARHEKGTLFFKFCNYFILKLENAVFKLDAYFNAFFQELFRRFNIFLQTKNSQIIDTLPYYCFIMSQIMSSHGLIVLGEENLKDILRMAASVAPEMRQYPLALFLTYIYLQPYPASTFLKNNNMYEGFLTQIVNVRFEGKIMTKILTISLIKLLEIEDNPNYFRVILNLCIQNLTILHRQSTQPVIQMINEPKVRRHDENKTQERILAEDDNQLINLFVKFKHPFQSLSEFDLFKVIYWQNDHVTNQLSEEQKKSLRSIMETQWVENKARAIKRVKKPQ